MMFPAHPLLCMVLFILFDGSRYMERFVMPRPSPQIALGALITFCNEVRAIVDQQLTSDCFDGLFWQAFLSKLRCFDRHAVFGAFLDSYGSLLKALSTPSSSFYRHTPQMKASILEAFYQEYASLTRPSFMLFKDKRMLGWQPDALGQLRAALQQLEEGEAAQLAPLRVHLMAWCQPLEAHMQRLCTASSRMGSGLTPVHKAAKPPQRRAFPGLLVYARAHTASPERLLLVRGRGMPHKRPQLPVVRQAPAFLGGSCVRQRPYVLRQPQPDAAALLPEGFKAL
jgi:hypothetical protein